MRYCPHCREGYEDHIDRCGECGRPLVAEPEGEAESRGSWAGVQLLPDEEAFDIFPLAGLDQAEEAAEALRRRGLQVEVGWLNPSQRGASLFRRWVPAVRVRRRQAQQALEVLIAEVPSTLPEAVLKEVWGLLASQKPELPAGMPPVLAEPLPVLLAGDPELHPALIRGYLHGGQLAARCHYVLVHMKADPEPALARAATAACLEGDPETLSRLHLLLSDLGGDEVVAQFRVFLSQAEPSVRRLVAWLLGAVATVEAAALLVEMLADEDPEVRAQVVETLGQVTGRDLSLDPEAEAEERGER